MEKDYSNKQEKERRKEQEEFYNKNLAPVLEKYEKIKRRHYITFFFIIIVSIIITAIATFIYKEPSFFDDLFGILFISFCLLLPFLIIYGEFFTKKIKKETLPIIFEYFKNINWRGDYSIDKSIIKKSGIIRMEFNSFYEGYGSFYGKHKDTNFEVSQVNFHGLNRPHIFNGIIIVIDMKKKFYGHTVILHNWKWLSTSYLKGLSKINIDNPKFNKYYATFTDDDNETKNLISPSFVNALTNVSKCIGFPAESCAFYNGKIYITIDSLSQDFLYMGSYFGKITTPKHFYKVCDNIEAIMKIIELFNTDD